MPNPSVDENVPVGTVIYKVTCSGPDKNQEVGSDEQQNLTITLPIDGDGFFKVVKDGSTHTLMVAQEGLNYEEKYLYPIEIKCCDSGNLCRSRAYKIRVKDVPEAPTAVDAAFSVEENSRVDTFIGVVPALAEGPKILMTFSITSGNNFNAFDINACGGALYVGSDVLNYESAETRNFVLEVTIKTALSVTVKVYIGVLDVNEPPSLEDYEITIDENTSIGTVVATKENMKYADEDMGESSIFSITDGNILDAFTIHEGTGEISVLNDVINYESGIQVYTLKVKVVDKEDISATCTVTINVRDINEPPLLPDGGESGLTLTQTELDPEDKEHWAAGTKFTTTYPGLCFFFKKVLF
eukprot:TRINITY_DN1815_c0_g1_i1.p1 TRINITY_DN1815_c0_g1~~TRINITY_DN1815_c0_g1_i1.p1  ORF type:complete len:355 (+),score=127.66 TRINITY_DN1815_c0_g1_i1:535-1599(+)